MQNRRWIFALAAGVGQLLALSTCKPACTEEELQSPIDLDPNSDADVFAPGVLVDLYWGYPDSTCQPDSSEAYVWTGAEPETPGMTGRIRYTNCRRGPSTRFGVEDTAFAGERLEIRACNPAGDWMQVLSTKLRRLCWIYPAGSPIEGDLGKVPVVGIEIP